MNMRNLLRVSLITLALCVGLFSCGTREAEAPGQGRLKVITTLFPVYDFARNIGGEKAHVTLLLPPGVEPHSFEPRPGDILAINRADIFVYTGKHMEPWVVGILKGIDNKKLLVIDGSKGIALMEKGNEDKDSHGHGENKKDHGGEEGRPDPHIWLDLYNAQKMVDAIRDGFIGKDPSHKEFYIKNAEAYNARLSALDERFKAGLSRCAGRRFIHGGHFAFGYLARRYNLEYISAYEGSPNAEPSPKRIIELKKLIRDNHIKYVYYEELITPRVAEVVARETGTTLLKLHGAHNVSREDLEKRVSFIGIMEQNLDSLRTGLECQ
ncbi:MAG: zinc-binding protein [Syntrophus sp. (in: bacteria)]|nr:zinc-binding protein [Syntrophus sp. (in: bacteria)]